MKAACRFVAALVSLLAPCVAQASGGDYAIHGGSAQERGQVRAALEASSFDWSIVPERIAITITRGGDSSASPGRIVLDANLLDAGRFSWGVVQHEYAHQVDFFLLDDSKRALLSAALEASTWWDAPAALQHSELGCERFASTLAWAYWPSIDNTMKPLSPNDEAGALPAPLFRRLLARLLGPPGSTAAMRRAPARPEDSAPSARIVASTT